MSAVSTAPDAREVPMPGGFAPNQVLTAGHGDPVVYLHGFFGQEWGPYLDGLAAGHTVYAPALPGIAEGEDLRRLDGFWDLVLYYDDLFDRLGLEEVTLVGHSVGGMAAAEYAATFRHRVTRLVLIDALGLWLDETPVGEYVTVQPEILSHELWHDPSNERVTALTSAPADPAAAADWLLTRFNSLTSAAHFTHPIPDRGLVKRLRRVSARTLVLWGAQDGLASSAYAQRFAELIPGAATTVIEAAGHFPQVEQADATARETLKFLVAGD
jgi:pimeloyl-ACP methyl ester carboxylesterase